MQILAQLNIILRCLSNYVPTIIALMSFPAIWLTYYYNWEKNEKEKLEKQANILNSMKADLEIMRHWIGPYETKGLEDYINDPRYINWFNATKIVYTFNHSSFVDAIKSSQALPGQTLFYAAYINQLILNLEQAIKHLSQDIYLRPDLLYSSVDKISRMVFSGKPMDYSGFTGDERMYINRIFAHNYNIHVGIIGNDKQEGTIAYNHARLLREVDQALQDATVKSPSGYSIMLKASYSFVIFGIIVFLLMLLNIILLLLL
jgi:hypothetical protein